MASIKEIQGRLKALGTPLSYGTVSNILANRGGTVKNISLVRKVAEELGYGLDKNAQSLRAKTPDLIVCIIPSLESDTYRQFYLSLYRRASERGFKLQLYITNDSPAVERKILGGAAQLKSRCVVTFTCLDDDGPYLKLKCPAVFVEREPKGSFPFVKFDYCAAAGMIADRAAGFANVLVISERREAFSFAADFARGLRNRNFACGWLETTYLTALRDIMGYPLRDFDAIICVGKYYSETVKSVLKLTDSGSRIPVYSVGAQGAIPDETSFEFNYQAAAEAIIGQAAADQPRFRSCLIAPERISTLPRSGAARTLNVLTMSGYSRNDLELLKPLVKEQLGIELNIERYDNKMLEDYKSGGDTAFDLIQLDVSMLPYNAAALLRPMEGRLADEGGFIPELPRDYFEVGGVKYAYPLNPNVQMLVYHDAFEDTYTAQKYYEANNREQLALPDNYRAYNKIAGFFKMAENDDIIKFGCAAYMRRSAARTNVPDAYFHADNFLPRLYDFHGSVFDSAGEPALSSPIALAALDNYIEMYACSPYINGLRGGRGDVAGVTSSAEMFMAGDCMFSIEFSSNIARLSVQPDKPAFGRLRYAKAPSALIGGGVIGVGRDCRDVPAAEALIRLIMSDEYAAMLTKIGIFIPRKSVLSNVGLLSDFPFLSIIGDAFANSVSRNIVNRKSSKLIDSGRLEEILGSHVDRAVRGKCSLTRALGDAEDEIVKLAEG